MCLLQGNRAWYASATDHAGTWKWPAYAVYFHRCSSWTRLSTCLLCPTTVQKTVVSAVVVLTRGSCPCCAGRRLGFLLEAFSHSANCAEDWRDPTGVVLGHGCDARYCTTTGAWVTTVQKTVGGRCPWLCSSSTVWTSL